MGKFVDFLKESDLFSNLFQTQLEMIECICEERTYKMGQTIFEEFSHESELYLILNGKVEIFVNQSAIQHTKENKICKQIITTMIRGQSFGEMALVDEGVRSAGARAVVNNTRLLFIPRKQLLILCNAYPEFGYQIMYNLAIDLAQKIRNNNTILREAILYGKPQNS